MRIISKFKDYYDSASSFGIDMECAFVREQKIITIPKAEIKKDLLPTLYSDSLALNLVLIGFCGEVYPVVQFKKDIRMECDPWFKTQYTNCYSIEEMKTLLPPEVLSTISSRSSFSSFRKDSTFSSGNWPDIERFFNYDFKMLKSCFVEHHSPVFTYAQEEGNYQADTQLTLNPELKKFQFFKQKDPVTAFQEIHMYLSGVLGNKEKEVTNVSDKVRIQQHGFDKYSFRKLPETK